MNIGGFIDNMGDIAERIGESIGIVDRDEATVSLVNGRLNHNIDLEGFSPEQVEQIENMLTEAAGELESIEEELKQGDIDPGREAMLNARKNELNEDLTNAKWELEHQQFNFGKMFLGNLIVPGGGIVAQGIGFDGDKRLESAMGELTPSPEELGVGLPSGTSSGSASGAGKPSVDELVSMLANDPDAFMEYMKSLDPEDRNHVNQVVQSQLQQINQMNAMMTNFAKAMHDTNKAIINNYRV